MLSFEFVEALLMSNIR